MRTGFYANDNERRGRIAESDVAAVPWEVICHCAMADSDGKNFAEPPAQTPVSAAVPSCMAAQRQVTYN